MKWEHLEENLWQCDGAYYTAEIWGESYEGFEACVYFKDSTDPKKRDQMMSQFWDTFEEADAAISAFFEQCEAAGREWRESK